MFPDRWLLKTCVRQDSLGDVTDERRLSSRLNIYPKSSSSSGSSWVISLVVSSLSLYWIELQDGKLPSSFKIGKRINKFWRKFCRWTISFTCSEYSHHIGSPAQHWSFPAIAIAADYSRSFSIGDTSTVSTKALFSNSTVFCKWLNAFTWKVDC